MIRICQKHGYDILDCSICFEVMSSSALFIADETNLQKGLDQAIKNREQLLEEKKEVLETLSTIKEKLYLKNPMLPKNYIKDGQLLDYIKSLTLPHNVLTLVYDPEFALAFLFQKNLINSNFICSCNKKCSIKRQGKHFFFVCDCGKMEHYTKGTIWEKTELPPSKIVFILFLWVMNITCANISQLVSLDPSITNDIVDKVREIIAFNYSDTLPKFRGVVEIDESCFKTGRDKYNKFLKDLWVFGLYERERKLVYMQVVSKRNAKTLIPIIQQRCEVGTTIISDQWNAYNKLEEFGFPHYTVDHSRFFVNPHSREIHTQNIEISWCWAKFNIKKHKTRIPLQYLLHIFCWMRQFKNPHKELELATILNASAEILSKYQEKEKRIE